MTAPANTTEADPATNAASASTAHPATDLSPEQTQAIARALADPRRFAILQQIAANDGLLCSRLDAQETISPATISHHLRELQEAGLIEGRRDGRNMCLRLRRSVWNAYVQQLQKI